MNTSHCNQSSIAQLIRLKNDRGALANLRCALRSQPSLRRRAWPLIARVTNLESPLLVIHETVAGLWATDPDSHRAGSGNFGLVCRKLRGDHESFDLRFRRLLGCDGREELCERLVPIALAAQRKGIAIDYDTLFADLNFFSGDGRDRVRTRWAQAYWATPDEEKSAVTETANSTLQSHE